MPDDLPRQSILDRPSLSRGRRHEPPPGMDPLAFALEVLTESMDSMLGDDVEDGTRPTSPLEWAERYRRPRGVDFSLAYFKPLRALYSDTSEHIVVMKPAQRGASEWAINVVMFYLDQGPRVFGLPTNQLNIGYIFPNQGLLSDFSNERFEILKTESPHLAAIFRDAPIDRVTMKRIRNNFLYLRGGWTDAGLKSFPADIIVLDEFDELRPAAVELARRRMNASRIRREIDLSTPSIPGRGIHAAYRATDQHEYETQCPQCGHWQTFDFFRDVRVHKDTCAGDPCPGLAYETEDGTDGWKYLPEDVLLLADVALHCELCHHAFDEDERCDEGRWTPRNPRAKIRGYHLPWWPFPFVRLNEYAAKAASPDLHRVTEFFRSDLGVPYQPSGASITEAMIDACAADLPNGLIPSSFVGRWIAPTMGVDVGPNALHYWVTARLPGEKAPYVVDAGVKTTIGQIDDLMRQWRIRFCVIDAQPEATQSKAFVQRWPGRAAMAYYTHPKSDEYRPEAAKIQEKGVVAANRTMALDTVYAHAAGALWHIPSDIGRKPMIRAHLTSSTRVSGEDGTGERYAFWEHTTPDHIFHAAAYDLLARKILAEIWATGDTVSVPGGVILGGVKGWQPNQAYRSHQGG